MGEGLGNVNNFFVGTNPKLHKYNKASWATKDQTARKARIAHDDRSRQPSTNPDMDVPQKEAPLIHNVDNLWTHLGQILWITWQTLQNRGITFFEGMIA